MKRHAQFSSRAGFRLRPNPCSMRRKQTGFVLVISLLMLVVLTILAVSMFRGFGLQEIMAGNLREKTRAIDAAQAAINYAEWWLPQGSNATTGVACAGLTATQVCSNPLANPTTVNNGNPSNTWGPNGTDYTPTGMTVNASGVGTFLAPPRYYIHYVGLASGGTGKLYRISAVGWGGNSSAVAVLQSTFVVSTGVQNLGGP